MARSRRGRAAPSAATPTPAPETYLPVKELIERVLDRTGAKLPERTLLRRAQSGAIGTRQGPGRGRLYSVEDALRVVAEREAKLAARDEEDPTEREKDSVPAGSAGVGAGVSAGARLDGTPARSPRLLPDYTGLDMAEAIEAPDEPSPASEALREEADRLAAETARVRAAMGLRQLELQSAELDRQAAAAARRDAEQRARAEQQAGLEAEAKRLDIKQRERALEWEAEDRRRRLAAERARERRESLSQMLGPKGSGDDAERWERVRVRARFLELGAIRCCSAAAASLVAAGAMSVAVAMELLDAATLLARLDLDRLSLDQAERMVEAALRNHEQFVEDVGREALAAALEDR